MGNLPHQRELRRQLVMRLQNSLIDCDIAVDDARRDHLIAFELVQLRERERDQIAAKLQALIDAETKAA